MNWILFFVFVFVFFHISTDIQAEEKHYTLNSDNEVIVDVSTLAEGINLVEGAEANWVENHLFVNLQQIVDAMGIAINVWQKKNIAEGPILDLSKDFLLDFAKCTYRINSQIKNYECNKISIKDNQVYADISLLNEILPAKFEFDSLKSKLLVEPTVLLPPIAKVQRSKQSVTNEDGTEDNLNKVEKKREVFNGFSSDLNIDFNKSISNHNGGLNAQSSSQFETMGFDSQLNMATNSRYWLSFKRKEPITPFLGDIQISEIQLHHFNTQSDPLVSISDKLRGVYLTNRPLSLPTNFSETNFEGELPIGYEVELYQNDRLIQKITDKGDGKYLFEKIKLFYGENLFRLTFFGPKGEIYHEYKRYNISTQFGKNQRVNFTTFFGQNSYGQNVWNVTANTPVYSRFNLFGTVQNQYLKAINKNELFKTLGFDTFLHSTTMQFSTAENNSKYAYRGVLNAQIETFTLSTEYDLLPKGWRSAVYNSTDSSDIKSNSKTTFITPLPLPGNWRNRLIYSDKKYYSESFSSKELTQVTSLSIPQYYFQSQLNYNLSSKLYSIKPSAQYADKIWQLKFESEYHELNKWRMFESELKYHLNNTIDTSATLSYEKDLQMLISKIEVIKTFKEFNLSMYASNSKVETVIGSNVNFNLTFLNHNSDRKFIFESNKTSDDGIVEIYVFQDSNYNGLKDVDEEPVTEVQVLSSVSNDLIKVNDQGKALLTKAPSYAPLTLSILESSLTNLNFKPGNRGLKVYPRPGVITPVFLPVISLFEIEGKVRLITKDGEKENPKNVLFEIYDSQGLLVKKTRSDEDGNYLFDNIIPGEYQIKINENYLINNQFHANESKRNFKITNANSMDNINYDFEIYE